MCIISSCEPFEAYNSSSFLLKQKALLFEWARRHERRISNYAMHLPSKNFEKMKYGISALHIHGEAEKGIGLFLK
jgi:hypothetical protein